MRIVTMNTRYAVAITAWRYPPPYDLYDIAGADRDFLAHPASGFFALLDGDELIGFRSFGRTVRCRAGITTSPRLTPRAACVPTLRGSAWAGRRSRRGWASDAAGSHPAFWLTIATFNQRAQRVVNALGFQQAGRFQGSADGRSYEVLVRQEAS
jgi:[ribosomal protein S18]-alanine N-acetyltransferase